MYYITLWRHSGCFFFVSFRVLPPRGVAKSKLPPKQPQKPPDGPLRPSSRTNSNLNLGRTNSAQKRSASNIPTENRKWYDFGKNRSPKLAPKLVSSVLLNMIE